MPLSTKNTIKRLGKPQEFLGSSFTFNNDGSISLRQPKIVQTTIQNTDMATENGRLTPYNKTEELQTPREIDYHMNVTKDKYRQLVGDLRYLADWTRPDLELITSKLANYLPPSTHRNWMSLEAVNRYLQRTTDTGINYGRGKETTTSSPAPVLYRRKFCERSHWYKIHIGFDHNEQWRGSGMSV